MNQEVRDFFNHIGDNYKSKYSERDVFHHYFFIERLQEASRNFSFEGKRVLDIGAGTGDLYDHLKSLCPSLDYYASDIAANMLAQSFIPADRRFVGTAYSIDFPQREFDFVFMLGVTTYLDAKELHKNFEFVHHSLKNDGRAVITFTNARSFDWKMRSIAKAILKPLGIKTRVLAQGFSIYPKALSEVQALTKGQFEIEEVRWLNHTVFPFNQFLKGMSVNWAKRYHEHAAQSNSRERMSSDFMVVMKKR